MNRSYRASALAIFALAAGAAQAILIDDFTSGPYSITANSVLPRAEAVRAGTMLGGERDALLEWMGGPQGVSASVVIGGGGAQFYNESSESNGRLTLQYDGFDGELETDGVQTPGSGLATNFSGDTQFDLFFRFVDAGLGANVAVTITVVSATGSSTFTSFIANGVNIMHSVAFSNFVGVDFANVQRLEFSFTSPAASDFTLDYIQSSSSIPGPAAAIPFAVGAFTAVRRRLRLR